MPDFRAVYRAEFAAVYNWLIRLGIRGEDVQDLAHDVFAAAYRRWETYDASRPVRPWLFGIAYRLVLDFKRKLQNQRESPNDELEAVDASRSAEDVVASKQGLELAASIIGSLELERRAVFVMHEIEGVPIPQVADAVGVPINTAYSRLRLARQDFNAAVKRLHAREARP